MSRGYVGMAHLYLAQYPYSYINTFSNSAKIDTSEARI
jgi:hypothetical protein